MIWHLCFWQGGIYEATCPRSVCIGSRNAAVDCEHPQGNTTTAASAAWPAQAGADFALDFALSDLCPLVVLLFATGEAEFDLHEAPLSVDGKR